MAKISVLIIGPCGGGGKAPGAINPGQVVLVVGGVWRGRVGVVCGAPDGTNSQRVTLDHRSQYDKGRPKDWAWIPCEFLQVKGK